MLEGMTALVRLHLDHNLIDFIEPLSFNGLQSLKLLQLDGNKLRDLHPYTFFTLSYLGHFWGSNLHHLHIADNNLKYLLPGILRPLSKLESLSIHGNPWTCDCNLRWLLHWNEMHKGKLLFSLPSSAIHFNGEFEYLKMLDFIRLHYMLLHASDYA